MARRYCSVGPTVMYPKHVAGEALAEGDLVYPVTDGASPAAIKWMRALATVATALRSFGVTTKACASGAIACVVKSGLVKSVTTGMTPGVPVYLAEGTSYGDYTVTAPSTQGDLVQMVGYAENATDVMVVDANQYALVHA
jgi:hypothetical protein